MLEEMTAFTLAWLDERFQLVDDRLDKYWHSFASQSAAHQHSCLKSKFWAFNFSRKLEILHLCIIYFMH